MPSESEVDSLVTSVRKNCRMCSVYKNIQPVAKEKPIVQASLRELYGYLLGKYDSLRRSNASGNEIVRASENRRLVLDLLDECNACKRQEDTINQKIKGMQF